MRAQERIVEVLNKEMMDEYKDRNPTKTKDIYIYIKLLIRHNLRGEDNAIGYADLLLDNFLSLCLPLNFTAIQECGTLMLDFYPFMSQPPRNARH